ncbi:MAG TPA: hypothetical protein PKL57_04785 [Candidatus Wallbacteria bacterium]|nr:hypothetical protein [Candidatus Wallbacteria bacterium]
MSGPKGFELKYILNSVWFCRDEISSLMERLNSFGAEISTGGFKTAPPTRACLKDFDALFGAAKQIAGRAKAIDGVDIYKRRSEAESLLAEMKKIAFGVLEMKKNIFHEILKLRGEVHQKIKNFENIKKSVASAHLSCGVVVDGGKLSEAGKKLQNISAIDISDCPAIDYDGFNYPEIASFEAGLEEAEMEMKKRYREAMAYIESLRLESCEELLSGVEIKKYKTAAELFEVNKSFTSNKENGVEVLEKSMSLISKFSVLNGGRKVPELLAGYDAIRAEENDQRRAMLAADFALHCERLLKSETASAALFEETAAIRARLQPLAPRKAALIDIEIKNARESEDIAVLEKIKASAAAVLEEELTACENRLMGEIIKAAFNEIGYETQEKFSTLLVKNQKMFISKPSMKNYMVQVVSNSSGRMLQMQIVRLAGGPESAEALKRHEIRDIEAETEFCADYEEALKILAGRGVEVTHKMRMKPGEVKVQTIKNPESKEIRPDAAANLQKTPRKL